MFHKRHPPPGSPPGALAAAPTAVPPRLRLIEYAGDEVRERDIADLGELSADPLPNGIRWIAVQGIGDGTLLAQLGERLGIHPLALADIVNTPQRPKLDPYDDHALLIARAVYLDAGRHIVAEQVSIVLWKQCVLSVEERPSDLLEPIRQRIRRHSPITRAGADYLVQAIVDTVIDGYYPLIEELGEDLETLERDVIDRPTSRVLRRIHRIKHGLLTVRRSIYPQRDAIQAALRRDSELFTPDSMLYFRDVYDHAVQVVDVLESFRDIAAGLMDVYLTVINNRTNEVMKVLTIIATIFIPLSFLVGVYGMNFVWMPELHFWWAYPVLWVVILTVAGLMLLYFRRHGWLQREDPLTDTRHPPRHTATQQPPAH